MDVKYTKSNLMQLEAVLEKLRGLLADAELPIEGWRMRTAKYIQPGLYEPLEEWREIPLGEKWAVDPEITAFFSVEADIPEAFRNRNTYLSLQVGGEALLRINGKAYHGLDRNRHMVRLEEAVKAGGKLELLVEAAVDRQTYEFQFRYWGAGVTYKEHRFAQARLVAVNEPVWEYYFDLLAAKESYQSLPEGEVKDKYFAVLKESILALDFIGGREGLPESLGIARAILNDGVARLQVKLSQSTLHLMGHSHIDVGYLWPVKETVRKCSRTFSTALRLMEQYGHYKFIQSQALLYDFMKKDYPEIYNGIKEKVKSGQWEVEGAMWVEPDCNLPSGESFIRQILIGKRFFKEEFGIDCRILWLPDTFGFTWTLPQIMKGCGIDYFATQKLKWNKTNVFPYDLFTWRSADGSEVLSLFTGAYNGTLSGQEIADKCESFGKDPYYNDHPLLYGYGDGGGGVTLEMLETAKRLDKLNKAANFKTASAGELFEKLEKTEKIPVWEDELYLEAHRGVYTSHAELKKLNRQCERLLRDAEFFLAVSFPDRSRYAAVLEEIWKKVLTNQFHDILPGSSIRETFDDAVKSYKEALEEAEKLKELALGAMTEADGGQRREPDVKYYTVWNTLGWERDDTAVIKLDKSFGGYGYEVTEENGSGIPCQVMGKEDRELVFPVRLPPMGYRTYRVAARRDGKPFLPPESPDNQAKKYKLENRYFSLEFNQAGNIASLLDKRTGRELIPAGREANQFRMFADEPQQYDAWEVEEFDSNRWYDNFELQEMYTLEDGPVIRKVRIVKHWHQSRICQDVVLYENMPRIDFRTEVDWQEHRKMLKVAFPVDLTAREATYDIAYGTIRRPTHDNTSWERAKFEVPAHMWADLSEYDYGVSLLNDSKYGYDIKGKTMRLTLLKAPVNPNPQADRGKHRFVYSLLPHPGAWQEGETARQAYQLNTPLTVLENKKVKGNLPCKAYFSVDCGNVFIEVVKPAEDGNGIIVRLLEKYGGQARVKVACGHPLERVYHCNMLEENDAEVECSADSFAYTMKPYKIETFRLLMGRPL